MKFTLTVPQSWNYTPSDLIQRYAEENDRKFIFTCNQYFTHCLHERATDTVYYYNHLSKKANADDTETVTVFLDGMRRISDHTDGSHIYVKLELNGEIYEVDNYAGEDCRWTQFKTTADGTDKREAVINAYYMLY